MSNNIPFKIQAEIIKFLPIKSLIQFRSVSKQWKSLIDSSEFISNYHVINSQPRGHIFVSYFDQPSIEIKYVSILDDDSFPTVNVFPNVPKSVKLLNGRHTINGSSNGLFLLYNVSQNNTAVIWNPTIRKSVDIDLGINVFESSYETILGFGVCLPTFDPKIVKITFILNDEGFVGIKYVPWLVEVYTISSGVWRSPLCNRLPPESIQLTGSTLDMDGFIYFLGYEWIDDFNGGLDRCFLIISFDMKTEEFTEIRLPTSLAFEKGANLNLSKFKDSMVLFQVDFKDAPHIVCNVWMMENDVKRSVTKLFTVNPHNEALRYVVGFRTSGELLVSAGTSEGHVGLYVYDIDSKHMTYVGFSRRPLSFFFAASYVETLLLLNH